MQAENINMLTDHLFRHESGKMVAVLTRIFGLTNISTAEDIVQDFFIYFWEKKYYLKINQNLRYYLYLSVRNAAINALQKRDFRAW